LGKVKDFLAWLSGEDTGGGGGSYRSHFGGGRRGNVSDAARTRRMIFKLKFEIKKITKQQQKLNYMAEKAKEKAKAARQRGDVHKAKLHAREMVRYRNLARNMDRFISNLEGMQQKLEMAQNTQQIANVLAGIDSSLQGMKEGVSVPDLQETLESIAGTMADLDTSLAITQEGIEFAAEGPEQINDAEIDSALSEIDTELATEGFGLPSPEGLPVDENEEQIKKWEDELKALKDK